MTERALEVESLCLPALVEQRKLLCQIRQHQIVPTSRPELPAMFSHGSSPQGKLA